MAIKMMTLLVVIFVLTSIQFSVISPEPLPSMKKATNLRENFNEEEFVSTREKREWDDDKIDDGFSSPENEVIPDSTDQSSSQLSKSCKKILRSLFKGSNRKNFENLVNRCLLSDENTSNKHRPRSQRTKDGRKKVSRITQRRGKKMLTCTYRNYELLKEVFIPLRWALESQIASSTGQCIKLGLMFVNEKQSKLFGQQCKEVDFNATLISVKMFLAKKTKYCINSYNRNFGFDNSEQCSSVWKAIRKYIKENKESPRPSCEEKLLWEIELAEREPKPVESKCIEQVNNSLVNSNDFKTSFNSSTVHRLQSCLINVLAMANGTHLTTITKDKVSCNYEELENMKNAVNKLQSHSITSTSMTCVPTIKSILSDWQVRLNTYKCSPREMKVTLSETIFSNLFIKISECLNMKMENVEYGNGNQRSGKLNTFVGCEEEFVDAKAYFADYKYIKLENPCSNEFLDLIRVNQRNPSGGESRGVGEDADIFNPSEADKVNKRNPRGGGTWESKDDAEIFFPREADNEKEIPTRPDQTITTEWSTSLEFDV